MYDNQRCPKAKGKRRRGLWFVSRSYLTWSPSSLTSLWSAAGGEERRESPLGKAGGAHVCDQGATVQRCRSSATSLRPRLWVMGEWGSLPRFLANKSCTTGLWNVLEPDLSGSVGLATGQQTLAETDRCWSGQGRACKTACNLSHHHHVLTKA